MTADTKGGELMSTGTVERSKQIFDSVKNGGYSTETQQILRQLEQSPPEEHVKLGRKLWYSVVSEHLASGEPMPQELREQCEIVFDKIFDDVTNAAAAASTRSRSS